MGGPPDSAKLFVGRIGRAVGLKGEVEVAVESDAADRFAPGSTLHTPDQALVVASSRVHGDRSIVTFEGIADRTAAESLRGARLYIDAADARPLEEGEYWDHDLVGCAVISTTGEHIGTVTDVLHHGANDVLTVTADGKEHLIPLIKEVVRDVVPKERITIEVIPGLLD